MNALQDMDRRPWDDLGAPSDPIGFPRPQLLRGRRGTVLCYNSSTEEHEVVENVLIRDVAGGGSSRSVRQAYWKIPYKEPIQTIMGHVEMCRVLVRLPRDEGETTDDSSQEFGGYDEDEEDIVFQWTDQSVAVKVNYADRMDRLRDRHAENPLQEIAAMQLLGNDPIHVLGATEVLFDGQNLNLVMRFCDSGDLFQLLQDNQNRPDASTPGLTEGEARYWFRQVMEGIAFLHSKGICHRDLSPENVMIDGDQSVIIDMGMCLRVPYVDPDNENLRVDINGSRGKTTRCLFKPQGPCGKLPYMCPEIYANRKPFDGVAADVWTAGTILFCMVTGNRSYQRPHISDPQFYWMTHGLTQLLSDWNVSVSDECVDLMRGMMTIDPRKRFTIDEVRNHPWFSQPDEGPMQLDRDLMEMIDLDD
jgi:serine/threonine protein kinase